MGFSITAQKLRELYWTQGLSLREIGVLFERSPTLIQRLMKYYNIPRRPPRGAGGPRLGHSVSKETRRKISKAHGVNYFPTKNELNRLYWTDQRSSIDIAKIFGVNKKTILRWMKRYKIPRRSLPEAGKLKVGEKNGFYGKKHTKNALKFFSKRHKQLWKQPEFARKVLKRWTTRPNSKETFLDSLLQKWFPNTFRYVGDGKVLIAGKCPDWVNDNHYKIIELFGDYWHNAEEEEERMGFFEEHGFDCLVIWEHELRNPEQVKQRLLEWNEYTL